MKFLKLLTNVLTALTTLSCCYQGLGWRVDHGEIYDTQNKHFNLSGISWFGFETQDFVVDGLWTHPMEFYLDLLKNNGFNTIRVPFSAEWIYYNFNLYPYDGLVSGDPGSQKKKSIEILDRLFELCEQRKMYIMLDLHRLHKEYISELWYSPTDNEFTADIFLQTWFMILDRYKSQKNLIAIDLLNEPHGRATWGNNEPSTDWNNFVQYAILTIQARYPESHWLYVVEGIGWGKDLSGVRQFPIALPANIRPRLVYSAHSYGKSVVGSVDVYNTWQLRQDWDNFFGFLGPLGYTYFIGEYGGITSLDAPWMDRFSDYLIENQMRNNFFWSLGPNSGDVQGLLLDDWTTLDEYKVGITKKLQPMPTF